MEQIRNAELLKKSIQTIYKVASRRTSAKFADDTIRSSMKTLERKFDFFKEITITDDESSDNEKIITIRSSKINKIRKERIGKAIESLIRMVYDELNEEAGLYFITELRDFVGANFARSISDSGVDLDQIQLEQHHAFERKFKKKKQRESGTGENSLGYNWKKVASWDHEEGSKFCTLYDSNGKVLDRINLDSVIQTYVETLSGEITDDPEKMMKEARVFEKEYALLELMHQRDMDADSAIRLLKITREELEKMIKKLSNMDMVQYVSSDTLELTDTGTEYVESQIKS